MNNIAKILKQIQNLLTLENQKCLISIKEIQNKRDRNNQLKNILKNKLEDELYKDGELFTKRTKNIAVINSIKG